MEQLNFVVECKIPINFYCTNKKGMLPFSVQFLWFGFLDRIRRYYIRWLKFLYGWCKTGPGIKKQTSYKLLLIKSPKSKHQLTQVSDVPMKGADFVISFLIPDIITSRDKYACAQALCSPVQLFVPIVKDLFDFDSSEDILRNERYARHVEAVTETVIAHILKKLKTTYSDIDRKLPRSKLNKIAKTIQQKLKEMKHIANKKKKKPRMKNVKKINHVKNKSITNSKYVKVENAMQRNVTPSK